MAEPRKQPTKCKGCGGQAFALAFDLTRRGAVTREHPDGKYQREVVIGGDYCEECGDRREAERKRTEASEKHRENLLASGLPAALHNIEFDGFPQREAVEAARAWSTGRLAGLCFTGDVGVGKTWLAAAAMWPMLYRRLVRWVDTAQLVASLRASFDDSHRAEALRVVTGSGPAVFDDLDKVHATDFAREALYAAINARVAAGSPLLVTTNEPISGLGEILGKPVMSRLAGYCEVIEMVGPDRRVAPPRPELRAA